MTPEPARRAAMRWDRGQFKTGDALDQPCPAAIDITGRMRALVFGPMVILPAGAWRLEVTFALSAEAARHPYILQFVYGDSLVEERLLPSGPGEYVVALDNAFALDAVAALRLWLAEPAFHGDLYFLGAGAKPVDGPAAP